MLFTDVYEDMIFAITSDFIQYPLERVMEKMNVQYRIITEKRNKNV